MKTLYTLVLLVAILSLSTIANAQGDAGEQERLSKARGTKVGIGVAIGQGNIILISNSGFASSGVTALLRVPLNINTLKIEPEVGVYSNSDKSESSGQTSESSLSTLRAGLGIFYNAAVTSDVSAYVGPKIGIVSLRSLTEQSGGVIDDAVTLTQETKRTDVFFGAVVGGEYFFSARFSIGAEVGLEYLSKGVESTTSTLTPFPGPQSVTSGSEFQTKSALTGRFYF